jgi:uncharacterized LabA/DUF88 family protein
LIYRPLADGTSYRRLGAEKPPKRRLFLFAAVVSSQEGSLRTNVYVDGFNLYKAVLSKTNYKWLDLEVLFRDRILPPITPGPSQVNVKFFTARIMGRYCADLKSVDRQDTYLRALENHTDNVSIILGHYVVTRPSGRCLSENGRLGQEVQIEKPEEKQTDVNIAIELYRDCAKGECDQVVLVSNDSDLAPALRAVSEDFPAVRRGLVIPTKGRKSQSLIELADWSLPKIKPSDLQAAQLPRVIHYRTGRDGQKRKHLIKPVEWDSTPGTNINMEG